MVLAPGTAKRVTIYVGEDEQYHGAPRYSAILDYLFYRGFAGATVMRGIAGFGADHHLHTTRILRLTENLPIKIEFMDSAEKVQDALPKLAEMAGTGLIEVHDVSIVKPAAPAAAQPAEPGPHAKLTGKGKLLRLLVSEADRWRDKPLYEALVEALRANDIAGVTVYRGIMGYGAHGKMHKEHVALSQDRPVMLSVIDTEEKLRSVMPVLDDMVRHGMIVMSDVDVITYKHRQTPPEREQEHE